MTKEQMQGTQERLNRAAKTLLLAEERVRQENGPEAREAERRASEEYLRARLAMREVEEERQRALPPRGVPAFPRGKSYPVHEPA